MKPPVKITSERRGLSIRFQPHGRRFEVCAGCEAVAEFGTFAEAVRFIEDQRRDARQTTSAPAADRPACPRS